MIDVAHVVFRVILTFVLSGIVEHNVCKYCVILEVRCCTTSVFRCVNICNITRQVLCNASSQRL